MVFQNRVSAGRRLALTLEKFRSDDPVVLGILRGGVVVAAEVAQALGARLDVIIPRKIGAPGNPELAIGAVAGDGQIILNTELIASLGVSQSHIDRQIERELAEITRRRRLYFGGAIALNVGNKITLIVDDGLATGYTALAAIKAVKALKPRKTILAVPVAPAETVANLAGEVDELICLMTPEPFFAVGQFYSEFHQVTDEEVVGRLKEFKEAG